MWVKDLAYARNVSIWVELKWNNILEALLCEYSNISSIISKFEHAYRSISEFCVIFFCCCSFCHIFCCCWLWYFCCCRRLWLICCCCCWGWSWSCRYCWCWGWLWHCKKIVVLKFQFHLVYFRYQLRLNSQTILQNLTKILKLLGLII